MKDMRTAEEILREVYSEEDLDESLQLAVTLNPHVELIIKAINEARVEAIKECAEAVRQNYNLTIDKGSILELIDQVK